MGKITSDDWCTELTGMPKLCLSQETYQPSISIQQCILTQSLHYVQAQTRMMTGSQETEECSEVQPSPATQKFRYDNEQPRRSFSKLRNEFYRKIKHCFTREILTNKNFPDEWNLKAPKNPGSLPLALVWGNITEQWFPNCSQWHVSKLLSTLWWSGKRSSVTWWWFHLPVSNF